MINLLQLVPKLINGVICASYDFEGITYRASSIEQRQDIVINNFTANQVKRIDLMGQLKTDLLLTGIIADVTTDDAQALTIPTGSSTNNYAYGNVTVVIHVIDRKNNKLVNVLVFPLSPTFVFINEVIFSPDYLYQIISSVNLNALMLTGKPIFKSNPIVVINSP
jgi:hypothetical protein